MLYHCFKLSPVETIQATLSWIWILPVTCLHNTCAFILREKSVKHWVLLGKWEKKHILPFALESIGAYFTWFQKKSMNDGHNSKLSEFSSIRSAYRGNIEKGTEQAIELLRPWKCLSFHPSPILIFVSGRCRNSIPSVIDCRLCDMLALRGLCQ